MDLNPKIQEARDAGYSDSQIADYMGSKYQLPVQQARHEGYDDSQIISHLAKHSIPDVSETPAIDAEKEAALTRTQGDLATGRPELDIQVPHPPVVVPQDTSSLPTGSEALGALQGTTLKAGGGITTLLANELAPAAGGAKMTPDMRSQMMTHAQQNPAVTTQLTRSSPEESKAYFDQLNAQNPTSETAAYFDDLAKQNEARRGLQGMRHTGQELSAAGEDVLNETQPQNPGLVKRTILGGIKTVPTLAAGVAGGLLGGPEGAVASMSAASGGEAYSDVMNNPKLSESEKAQYAASTAGLSAVFNSIPVTRAFAPGVSAVKRFLGSLALNVPAQEANTIAQHVLDVKSQAADPWNDQQWGQAIIDSAIQAGLFSGAHTITSVVKTRLEAKQKAQVDSMVQNQPDLQKEMFRPDEQPAPAEKVTDTATPTAEPTAEPVKPVAPKPKPKPEVKLNEPGEQAAPSPTTERTIDKRALADAFYNEDGSIDVGQATDAVRSQVKDAIDNGMVVIQHSKSGAKKNSFVVDDPAKADVQSVVDGKSRLRIVPADSPLIDQLTQPKGDSNERQRQRRPEDQGQGQTLLTDEQPSLADKAKEVATSDVAIKPTDEGFTLTVDGKPTATAYPTIEEAKAARDDLKASIASGDINKKPVVPDLPATKEKTIAEIQREHMADAQAKLKVATKPEKVAEPTTAVAPIDEAAHEAATSPMNTLPEPTPAQHEAGNYQKGHLKLHGLDISIENPKGSIRSSKPGAAVPWQNTMQAHYGYIRGTIGKDKDHLDVFVGPEAQDPDHTVFVFDQPKFNGTGFDEHKIMLGFEDLKQAKAAYSGSYNKEAQPMVNAVKVSHFSMDEFKKWIAEGDHQQPASTFNPRVKTPIKTGEIEQKQESKISVSADKILLSKKGFDAANANNFRGKGSKTSGPLDVWKLDDGRLLLVDGYHRYAKMVKDGETKVSVNIVGNGYTDHATPLKGDTFSLKDENEVIEAPEKKKIKDFGEKLEGARKDYAAKLRDAESKDVATASLSESWPEPNYQKLLENGSDPWAVSFMHAARDSVPPKPKRTWKLKAWAEKVGAIREISFKLANGEMNVETAKSRLDHYPELHQLRNQIDLYNAVGHDVNIKGITLQQHAYGLYNGVEYSPPKRIWTVEKPAESTALSNFPRVIAHAETKEQAIEQFKQKLAGLQTEDQVAKSVKFSLYSTRGTGEYFIGKKIGKTVVKIKTGFKDLKVARDYMAENHDELVSVLEKMKDVPYERRTQNSPRVGADYRHGADVSPEQFQEQFGFRGVQFGNYVENDRRQRDLNQAYDALMDLAGVIDVPPRALSLNGELGLAFGARGKGGKRAPAAHYELGRAVINLTKGAGAGSLAHEWFHGLDNYFAGKAGQKTGMVTLMAKAPDGIRPEVFEAFKDILRAVKNSDLMKRSLELDETRSKPYWSTMHELAARSFETYTINKLRDAGGSNDYLANVLSKEQWDAVSGGMREEDYPYPTVEETPAIRAAFDHFFNTIEHKENNGNIEIHDLAIDDRDNMNAVVKRASTHIFERHDIPFENRMDANDRLTQLKKMLDVGRLTPAEFVKKLSELHTTILNKSAVPTSSRGAEHIRYQLQRAQDLGYLDPKGVAFAKWFIDKNPKLVDELGVLVRDPEHSKPGTNGTYYPIKKIMELITATAKQNTAVHEMLHHLEQLMPPDMQKVIRNEYWKQLQEQLDNAVKNSDVAKVNYLDAAMKYNVTGDPDSLKTMRQSLLDSEVPGSFYQYYNPTEFWAVNATHLLTNRYRVRDSRWGKIKNWLKEFIEHVRNVFGMTSYSPLLKAFRDLVNGKGLDKTSGEMLDKRMSPNHRQMDTPPPKEPGTPKRDGGTPKEPKKSSAAAVHDLLNSVTNNEFVNSFHRLFSPSTFDEAAKQSSAIARSELGDLAHNKFNAIKALEKYSVMVEKLPIDAQLRSIDDIENGRPQNIKELQAAADAQRAMLDQWREKVQSLGTGALENWIDNYFPHYWQDPDKAKKIFSTIGGRSPLRGPATFLKKRTIPTIKEGMDAGLKPLSTNPLILTALKIHEMQRFYTGVKIMQKLKEAGLAKFHRSGRPVPDGWVEIKDAVARVKQWSDLEQGFIERGHYIMPEGGARVINNHLSVSVLQGFLPAQIFRAISNSLNALQLSMSAFHLGFTTLDAVISKNALGLERLAHGEPGLAIKAFSEAMTGPGAAGLNLYRGLKLLRAYGDVSGATPELQKIIQMLKIAGGRVTMDRYFLQAQGGSPFRGIGIRSLASDVKAGLSSNNKIENTTKAVAQFAPMYAAKLARELKSIAITSPAWSVPFEVTGRIVRASTSLIMEKIVPLQKLGVFSDLAADYFRRNPTATPEEAMTAMQSAWQSVDNRLGEMNYDNLFWNRTFKDIMHFMMRAVGWNYGTVSEIGGAPVDTIKMLNRLLREKKISADDLGHKIPYVMALTATTMLFGAALQYMLTGKGPEEPKDYFFPKDGGTTNYGTPSRVSLPSYVKDIYEFSQGPGDTALNKANPIFSMMAAMWKNENFYGYPIYEPAGTTGKKTTDMLKYVGKEAAPFSLQGAREIAGSNPDTISGKAKSVLPFIGITPAPGRVTSPDELHVAEIARKQSEYASGLKRTAEKQARNGDLEAAQKTFDQYREAKGRAVQLEREAERNKNIGLKKQAEERNQ